MKSKHLDIGCGNSPKNPYKRDLLYGVDILFANDKSSDFFRTSNLVLEPIPFPDDYFESVSAFDFLEHVPRQVHLTTPQHQVLNPFVNLLSEIWRVLKPNGLFYAITPAYPKAAAFCDPTHVNFITEKTHEYFCGDRPFSSIYGFNGGFKANRVEWVVPKDALDTKVNLGKIIRYYRRKLFNPEDISHLVWELVAIKN